MEQYLVTSSKYNLHKDIKMKLGLQVGNISEPPVGDYEVVDFNQLQNVHDASCEDIFIGDCLDYSENREQAAAHVLSKIRYGGKGTITGIDLLKVCSLRKSFKISDKETREMIYSNRKCISSMSESIAYLKQAGMKVDTKRVDGVRYCIIFRRPAPNEN